MNWELAPNSRSRQAESTARFCCRSTNEPSRTSMQSWEKIMTNESGSVHDTPLSGLRVLVVEDDYFIADELCSTLRNNGAEVLGPSPDIEQSLDLIRSQRIDCAVLDINLHGNLAFNL